MSTSPSPTSPSATSSSVTVALEHRFADELPEMAVAWQPAPAPGPRLLVLDEGLAAELGLDPAWLRSEDGVRLLTGERVPEGALPVAQAYSGHQFGGLSPRLGDGRALLLGELVDRHGRLRDLHLKGSGRTPFARAGDGLAAVGPMLREHVVATAMHALGIPTTRSLGVVATGRQVRRETWLPGAVLARVASSHLRVGSFQYAALTRDDDLLRRLVDVAVRRHHPQAADAPRPALALLEAVVAVQADLVARWMLVGFVHGVMNTDNMTVSGETIDYGPCAFMEAFDPGTVYSSIDTGGRYAYGNQPVVAAWDLARLAEALLPLLGDDEDEAVAAATAVLDGFRARYAAAWHAGMRAKLGLPAGTDDGVAGALAEDLLPLLQAGRVDHTSFYRRLADVGRAGSPVVVAAATLFPALEDADAVAGAQAWVSRWQATGPDAEAMDRVNPVYVPRNALVEEALDAATAGDLGPLTTLLEAVSSPFDRRAGLERYELPSPGGADGYVTFCGT
ncbi:protein adenylyltransferase SelO [Aquipuribacter hungaricus]|uniref:Protein nucleotidyltransferase YdiU n=1 Tax=Aquipuribacter hungaricus TaxID=545624 RepID=A0ABV7WDC9_9MICO